MSEKKHGGQEDLVSGIAFTILFGFLYFRGGSWIWLLPLVFVGIMPLVRGGLRLLERGRGRLSKKSQRNPRELKGEREKDVLRLARRKNGVVTPTVVALHTPLSLQEAEQLLGDLASRGYMRLEVDDEGTLKYYIPEFLTEASEQ
jgi:hypothetical protein